jgi:hypothetical protein
MDKKGKIHLTNEEMKGKFKSSFELVNYAIKLAENMIKSGRDARVKSDIQNRAMLILEEIHEGKDVFDELKTTSSSTPSENQPYQQPLVYEELQEKRKYRSSETYNSEE